MMKVAELSSHRQFRMVDAPVTDPGPGQVQARVKAVGICGSDLHYFAEGGIGDTAAVYPSVLGHEPTGEIVKLGAGVSGWAVGDTAVLEPAIYCYHCEFCLTGHHNVCSNLEFMSTPTSPGFFREYVNVPAKNLLPVPGGLGLHQATLFEPLAVILHSLGFASIQAGETAAVIGAGPIGLLTVAALKLAGAGRIWSIEPIAQRRALAKQMGADAVIDPREVDAVKQVLSDTGKRGVDAVFDCASKGDTINQSLDMARSAGRVIITGIPSEVQVPLNFHTIRRKELYFYTVRRSNHETDEALRLMREYPKLFAPVVTHTRPLDNIQGAFEMLERYDDGVGKLVLMVG
jgi:L-iditol 2-dehydrogenase